MIRKYLKMQKRCNRNTAYRKCEQNGTSNDRATWTISKPFPKYLDNIPEKYDSKELQKTA